MAKANWTVAEAKSKFSEVLERARRKGLSGLHGTAKKPQW